MSYTPNYANGWQNGEEGETPITAATLNHIEDALGNQADAIDELNTNGTASLTYINNAYADSTAVGRCVLLRRNGRGYALQFNLVLTTEMPASANTPVSIATIPKVATSFREILHTVPPQNYGNGSLVVQVTSSGELQIANYSGQKCAGFYRAIIPLLEL